MEFFRVFIMVFIIFPLFFSKTPVHCRLLDFLQVPHFRKLSQSQVSIPPSPAPMGQISLPPFPAPKAAFLDSSSRSAAIFSVLSFGAVGDGVTDDTQAFKMAWDAACQNESATIFVPSHYTFMIQSTIFTGPCKSGLIFQVMQIFLFSSSLSLNFLK